MSSKLKSSLTRGSIVIAMLALTFWSAGCGSGKEIRLDASDNGRQIEVKEGQTLVITLEANPTTGYSWDAVDLDEAILRQTGEPQFESSSKVIGAGGTQITRFETLKAGQTTLRLIYHRPWEKDVEPLETFSIQIVVR